MNTGATVDHDCILEDFVHIAPGVHLAGNVTLKRGVFCGINSCVIPGKEVGEWTTVGAGSVVTKTVGSHQIVVGVPAKLLEKKSNV